MAEYDTAFDTGSAQEGQPRPGRRGPSILLLISGVVALLVSAWALVGPFSVDFLATFDGGWILVGVAVVIGAVLVFLPNRRSK
ncbi:hypothetical protein [Rhodococcus sp. NPDC058639]|uniref:hypothetical protein n=1 Tax=Rhodococcus sp. NPDC058639 TaxID=3346570 RepID=UPI00364CB9B7